MTDARWKEIKDKIADSKAGGGTKLDLFRIDLSDAAFAAEVFAHIVQQLPGLQWLDLDGTQVGDDGLKALAAQAEHLSGLQRLDLNGTQVGDDGVKALAAHAEHLSGLQWLDLSETRVRSVATEILESLDARQIFRAALRGIAVAEAKVVVLGEPAVGKSCLCQRFFLDQIPPPGRDATRDFEILKLNPQGWQPHVENLPVRLHVWDFGGQHILHGTHEMFLTERTVCLLVLDVTQVLEHDAAVNNPERDGNRLGYWLKMIRHFIGPDATVILVVTQCGQGPKHHQLGNLDPGKLQKEHQFTSTFRLIESFSARGQGQPWDDAIQSLRQAIDQTLDSVEAVRARVSPELKRVKDRVEREIETRAGESAGVPRLVR